MNQIYLQVILIYTQKYAGTNAEKNFGRIRQILTSL